MLTHQRPRTGGVDRFHRSLDANHGWDVSPRPTTPAPAIPIQGPALHLLGGF
jgi:hypothetical protein